MAHGAGEQTHQLEHYNFGGEEEDSYWWKTEPPISTIGILRLHVLLFVGKAEIGGRMYRVAVVPKDIREELVEMLK